MALALAPVAADDDAPAGTVIGIDLGTTYSCVAVMVDGSRVEIIPNDQGNRITPSYVAFTETERLIGDAAKNQAAMNPENTVFDAKRLIGRNYNDKIVQQDRKLWPFEVVSRDGRPYIQADFLNEQKQWAPEEISAMVVTKMKLTAEEYLGYPITDAVITVPAYFNDAQRQATRDAGSIAGLNVRRILNEPTAAAIAYGLDKKDQDLNIVVFDLGGGTFDVSLLNIEDGVFEVLATAGDTHLGGQDFDQNVMDWVVKQFKKKHANTDPVSDKRAMQKLRREVERAKRSLSSVQQTTIEIEAFHDGIDLSEKLSRARFEDLNMNLFRKTLAPVRQVLTDAGLDIGDVDEVVLVGGSTRIPKVQEMMKDFFKKEPSRSINPDEAVAYGAAVQGGILSGAAEDIDVVVVNVTPLTLGIETVGGVMAPVVERGTSVPARRSQSFSTAQDNQQTVLIQVYEGERSMTADNRLLGTFEVSEIPAGPRGVPQIEVTFEVDSDGILQVSATEQSSGSSNEIRIDSDSGHLTEEEIEQMIREAKENEGRDRAIKEKVLARNAFEMFVYDVRNNMNDEEKWGAQLSDNDLDILSEAVDEALEWLETNPDADKEEIDEAAEAFKETVTPVIEEFAGAAGGEGDFGDFDFDEL